MNAQTPQGGMAGRLPSMQAARWLAQARNEKGHPQGVAFLRLKLDDDLLSHGEAPHYHRRCTVSRLSSEWDQVVPMLYVRQAIRLGSAAVLASAPEFGHVQSRFDVWGVAFAVRKFSFWFAACCFWLVQHQIVWVLYGQASRAISTG